MKSHPVRFRWSSLVITFAALLLFSASSSSVLANGKGHHQAEGGMSAHMQSMLAAREAVPEEYRIMDRTPISPGVESLQQGRKLFSQNCSVCHGEKGDGNGPAASALETPPANFLAKKHSAMYRPGEKYWIIGNGTETTGMPAFSQFTPAERWHLVNFILELQGETQEGLEDLFSPR